MEEQTKTEQKKKFNKVNLPFLIAVGMFIITILSPIIAFILYAACSIINPSLETSNIAFAPMGFAFIFNIVAIPSIPLLCIIGLILQIINKNKNTFDKVMLALNSVAIALMFILVVFAYIAFPNVFVKEEQVRTQINTEFATLNKEYQPVLDYLSKYKKSRGVYPDEIDEKILPKSNTFDKFEYHVVSDKKGYWLEVYPKNGPIEFYYNDENDNGYEFYKGNGQIDSAFTNYNYYEIDKNWHAIQQDLVTRHSRFVKNQAERDTDVWMKDNVDKFENTNSKVKKQNENNK